MKIYCVSLSHNLFFDSIKYGKAINVSHTILHFFCFHFIHKLKYLLISSISASTKVYHKLPYSTLRKTSAAICGSLPKTG